MFLVYLSLIFLSRAPLSTNSRSSFQFVGLTSLSKKIVKWYFVFLKENPISKMRKKKKKLPNGEKYRERCAYMSSRRLRSFYSVLQLLCHVLYEFQIFSNKRGERGEVCRLYKHRALNSRLRLITFNRVTRQFFWISIHEVGVGGGEEMKMNKIARAIKHWYVQLA